MDEIQKLWNTIKDIKDLIRRHKHDGIETVELEDENDESSSSASASPSASVGTDDTLFDSFFDLINFTSKDGFNEFTTTGGTSFAYSSHLHLITASGAPSNYWLAQAVNYKNIHEVSKALTVEWVVQDLSISGGQQTASLFMANGTPPITTQQGFGFKIINNYIYCWNGNGVNTEETNTGLLIQPSLTNESTRLKATSTRNEDVRFYVDGELVATHLANLPTTGDFRIALGIETGNDGDESIEINRILIKKEYTF
jgi:hypothetical protein